MTPPISCLVFQTNLLKIAVSNNSRRFGLCISRRSLSLILYHRRGGIHHHHQHPLGWSQIKWKWIYMLIGNISGHHSAHYMGLFVFSSSITLLIIVKICVIYLIIFIESEVWIVTECPGYGNETMEIAVCMSCDIVIFPIVYEVLEAKIITKFKTKKLFNSCSTLPRIKVFVNSWWNKWPCPRSLSLKS